MRFPKGDLFSIGSFLLAGEQTCQLYENDLVATGKRLKKKNPISKPRSDLLSIFISKARGQKKQIPIS